MIIDHHIHLEEGPYSVNWLKRTAETLTKTSKGDLPEEKNTLQWINQLTRLLHNRVEQGCFNDDWVKGYVQQAEEKKIQRLGIVDHLYRFKEFKSYYEKYLVLDDSEIGNAQKEWLDQVAIGSIDDFITAINKAKEAGYSISLGVEADFFPGGEKELGELLANYEFDYVIGSVHFIDGWGFDNPELQHIFNNYDLLELYTKLFESVKQAAKCGLFDMIAHLDNLKAFNYRPDENDLLHLYEDVAQTLKEANIATEVNTGLAYRYPVKEMCPSPAFMQVLSKYNVPITMSSDAHYPDDIGTMLDEAKALIKHVGYDEIVYFKEKKRISVPIK